MSSFTVTQKYPSTSAIFDHAGTDLTCMKNNEWKLLQWVHNNYYITGAHRPRGSHVQTATKAEFSFRAAAVFPRVEKLYSRSPFLLPRLSMPTWIFARSKPNYHLDIPTFETPVCFLNRFLQNHAFKMHVLCNYMTCTYLWNNPPTPNWDIWDSK